MNILDIGCGRNKTYGSVGIDFCGNADADVRHDLNSFPYPFAENTFDGVISNLTFHEVKPVPDKRDLVREALRVVKPGGTFAFVDYFYCGKFYGRTAEFESYLRKMNLSQFEFKPLHRMIAIPVLLRHPKIFGRVGIVYGKK